MQYKARMGKWLAALCLAAISATAQSASYTITIEGVDLNALPDTAAPGYTPVVLAGMFVGMGNCNPTPGFLNSCDGTVAVATNPLNNPQAVLDNNAMNGTNFSNAAIFGYGLLVDQMIFHAFSQSIDVTNGVITGGTGLHQTFDFVVGPTGGGSAGPDPNLGGAGSVLYLLDFARNVTISGPSLANPITILVHQAAQLSVGWEVDTLLILPSDPVQFDLGADGFLELRLLGEGPIEQGDPEIGVQLNSTPVPLPSTLALAVLGLAALVRRKGRAA